MHYAEKSYPRGLWHMGERSEFKSETAATLRCAGLRCEFSRYNITAKAQGETPMDQMFGPMLQVLLEDRFWLKVHRDTRDLAVYMMTVAKGGLKIRAAKEGSCIPLDLNHADQASPNFCGRMTGKGNGVQMTDDAYGMSMAEIASRFLANQIGPTGHRSQDRAGRVV